MKRMIAGVLAAGLLASCSSHSSRERSVVTRVAGGPITAACMQAGRSGATRERCGCVQSVANRSLSSSDQRLGATFFKDPHRAQEIRQSGNKGNSGHEDFWTRWYAFGSEAAKICG